MVSMGVYLRESPKRAGMSQRCLPLSSLSKPFAAFLIFLYVLRTLLVGVYSCSKSPLISQIPDIVACDGMDYRISFTFLSNLTLNKCEQYSYVMYIFYHNSSQAKILNQSPLPFHNISANMCLTHATLDRVTFAEYHNRLLQIWMYAPVLQCSNNFTATIGVGK